MSSIAKPDRTGRTAGRVWSDVRTFAAARGQVVGWLLLVVAAAVVGVAIELDSTVGRAVNGAGGVLWLLSAGLLVSSARHVPLGLRGWLQIGATVVALSWLLSPRDLGAASLGFFAGGLFIAVTARRTPSSALGVVGLLPALWLPTHIGIAVCKAMYRALTDSPTMIRTDPPPTAALVPLAMVVATLVGGLVGDALVRRRELIVGPPPDLERAGG